jgi:hypothetical protein
MECGNWRTVVCVMFLNVISRDLEEDAFRHFLTELIKLHCLEGIAEGITRKVIDRGRNALSSAQESVFLKEVIGQYVHKNCNECRKVIAWPEMFFALDTGICRACDSQLRAKQSRFI